MPREIESVGSLQNIYIYKVSNETVNKIIYIEIQQAGAVRYCILSPFYNNIH